MKLKHITFTGIDAKTPLWGLIDLQKEYPIAEFGVLMSYKWQTNGNRYLDPALLSLLDAGRNELNLSLHICGRATVDAMNGDWTKIDAHLFGNLDIFSRTQLNIGTRKSKPEYAQPSPDNSLEVIIQQKDVNSLDVYNNTIKHFEDGRFSVLLDASGGNGINTPINILPIEGKVGYAGGFNPDNAAEKLAYLFENHTTGDFWIDMETGVRTDDWFDLDKAQKVLESCQKVIKQYEKV
jgi:hypothetical protein